MITLESLMEEAERLGLPLNKKRAILREYLQVLILNAIYRHKLGNKMFFMGGTALRFFYKMPRFSEDLDFNAEKLTSNEFDLLLDTVATSLRAEGFKISLKRKDVYDVYSTRIGFQSVMKNFGLIDQRGEDVVIKVETNNPKWNIRYEPHVFSAFGVLFTALLMDRGSLLAEKSHAFINRCRGRDVYDVLFLLRLKFPLDKDMFLAKKIEDNPKEALLNKFMSLEESDLKKIITQVHPFLFKEDEIEILEKAPFYARELLKNYD